MIIVLMLPLFFLSCLVAVGFFFVGYYPKAAFGPLVDAWRKARGAMKRREAHVGERALALAFASLSALSPGASEAAAIEPKVARSCVIYQIREAGSGAWHSTPYVLGCDGAKIEETRVALGQSLKWLLIGRMGFRTTLECSEHEAPSLRWTVCHDWPV